MREALHDLAQVASFLWAMGLPTLALGLAWPGKRR